MENDNVNKKLKDFVRPKKIICNKCKKIIPSGEYYVESILVGKIFCSDCDEGLLITGDIFYSIDE